MNVPLIFNYRFWFSFSLHEFGSWNFSDNYSILSSAPERPQMWCTNRTMPPLGLVLQMCLHRSVQMQTDEAHGLQNSWCLFKFSTVTWLVSFKLHTHAHIPNSFTHSIAPWSIIHISTCFASQYKSLWLRLMNGMVWFVYFFFLCMTKEFRSMNLSTKVEQIRTHKNFPVNLSNQVCVWHLNWRCIWKLKKLRGNQTGE